jgi:putative flippase GtrA
MTKQTFRYIACGGINFVVTMLCYAVAYNYVFAGLAPLAASKLDFHILESFAVDGFIDVSHYAALAISLPINCLVGFWLQKSISFKHSPLKRHIQFFRYFFTAIVALAMTIGLTGLFVDVWGVWPTPSQMIIYCITAVFSFVMQKFFTFRGADKE